MTLLSRTLGYTASISLEKWFGFLIPLPFERSTRDLKQDQRKLINNVKGRLPGRAKDIDDLTFFSAVGNELGKDQYVTGLKLSYMNSEGRPNDTELVIKYLSVRDEPLLLCSIKSALYRGLNREVVFYKELAGEIPFITPRCLYADWIPSFYRGILVMEKLRPDLMIDDHAGCRPDHSKTVLRNLAAMHAKFWNKIGRTSATQWLPDRHPLDVLWFLKLITKKEKACRLLWKALYQHFAYHPLTVTHGDSRPGNIMWFDNGSIAMLDWQFVHAGIGTWDAAYYMVMAHDVATRRAQETTLIRYYYNLLSDSYRNMHAETLPYPEERCLEDYHSLKFIVALYGWAALVSHMFDRYGNDPRDVQCWADRITSAITDLDSAVISKTIRLSSGLIDDFKAVMVRASAMTKERFVLNS